MWSIYHYKCTKFEKILLLGFMHMVGINLKYGCQKMEIMTIFCPINIFSWDLLILSTG